MAGEVIWAYTGHSSKSHYWEGFKVGRFRKSLCGKMIEDTGDDYSAPGVECKSCLKIKRRGNDRTS